MESIRPMADICVSQSAGDQKFQLSEMIVKRANMAESAGEDLNPENIIGHITENGNK